MKLYVSIGVSVKPLHQDNFPRVYLICNDLHGPVIL